jgi:hypothetical protein
MVMIMRHPTTSTYIVQSSIQHLYVLFEDITLCVVISMVMIMSRSRSSLRYCDNSCYWW